MDPNKDNTNKILKQKWMNRSSGRVRQIQITNVDNNVLHINVISNSALQFLYENIDRKMKILPMLIEKHSSQFTFMMENPKNSISRWILHEYRRFSDKILSSDENKRF